MKIVYMLANVACTNDIEIKDKNASWESPDCIIVKDESIMMGLADV